MTSYTCVQTAKFLIDHPNKQPKLSLPEQTHIKECTNDFFMDYYNQVTHKKLWFKQVAVKQINKKMGANASR
jgi:hypothetical protein